MANSDVKLRIENLTKSFGNEVAVDGLSMTIQEGNLKSLLGPSGCGKTTTLRCIAGLETPDSGRIFIDGDLVSAPEENVNVPPEKRDIGMVFQSYAVWPHLTVEQNVRYPLKVRKIGTKDERAEMVQDVLERVGLDPYAENLSTNLSGGQQQRVAIARALVVEPDILLFDEPLSNLDAKLRREMRLEIKRLYEEFNTTVLYVTHSQDEAMFLSDQIALMLDGSIVEEGDPVDLHTHPQTYFGMNFMGQCNTYHGTIGSVGEDTVTVETALGDLTVNGGSDEFRNQDRVFVCFRPKSCRILSDGDPGEEGEIVLDGTITMLSATQDFFEYQMSVQGTSLLARSLDAYSFREGEDIRVAIDEDDLKLFDHGEGMAVIDRGQGTPSGEDQSAHQVQDATHVAD